MLNTIYDTIQLDITEVPIDKKILQQITKIRAEQSWISPVQDLDIDDFDGD